MRKLFRNFYLFLAIAMLALLVGACGAPAADTAADAATGSDTASGESAAAETDSSDGDVFIDFWHIQNQSPEINQDAVDRFMADNPGVDVEVSVLQNDPYKTKIKVAMGAGNPPCVFLTWGGGPLYEYVKAGQAVDLTPYMDADNYKDRFVPASLSNVTFDGKIWGVPVENSAIAVFWYNKNIFDEYGLTPPATWDELMTVAETLKENGIIPFALANKTKWTSSMYYMYLVDRLGGPEVFAKAATRTGGSFEDPVFVQAGEMIQEMVNNGYFNEGFNGLDYDTGQSRQLLYSGKAAMELMGNWQLSTMRSENPEFEADSLSFFPFPAVEGGAGDPSNVVGTVGDNYYSVSSACPYPDQAFEMITYLIDDESIPLRAANGRIPPVKGFESDDPALQEIIDLIGSAASVQLWYDQYLPPELGEVHKDTMQSLFGLEITPEEAATAQEEATANFYDE
ncbi:MAG: extracellular solute-binding protein [Caldilineaceae bacterium]|nr:extracellular solute-binding protein [Caldilineaceae bacterium]